MGGTAVATDYDSPWKVLAHLKARQTQGDAIGRHTEKTRLVRGLYERGFSARDVRELSRVIDWFMVLPQPVEETFRIELEKFQEEKHMPYVTSIERGAIRGALRKGIESLLRVRFGDNGVALMPAIREVHYEEKLEEILTALETVASPDEVRRLVETCKAWSPAPSAE
jgi:hypothetical protein